MALSLSVPWRPVYDGKVLPSFALYDNVVAEGHKPGLKRDPTWTTGEVDTHLASAEEGRESFQESVLALWRLRLCLDEGHEEKGWKLLVAAWLVRGLLS